MATFGERIANFLGGSDADTNAGLRDLFITGIQNLYYAERVAIDALGNSADVATTDEVRNAFLQHQEESRQHQTRLEQVLKLLNEDVKEGSCAAADGLTDDMQALISGTDSGSLTRDAALIIAGQQVEHHEIATYGSLVTLAWVLGFDQSAELLQQTLDEEKATDKKLTQLAESFINNRAALEGNDKDDDADSGARPVRYAASNDATLGGTLGI